MSKFHLGFLLGISLLFVGCRTPSDLIVQGIITPNYEGKVSPTRTQLLDENETPQVLAVTSTPAPQILIQDVDLPVNELQEKMLRLINQVRQENGLTPVAWDGLAAAVGQAHAEEMAEYNYMSHWNMEGSGPDIRYSFAGGIDHLMENVFSSWKRFDNGTPVPIDDWNAEILKAHESLMSSPGHRANILDPAHTHVGFGIAYDPSTGEFRVAQEFTNHYIELVPFSSTVGHQEPVDLSGWVITDVDNIIVNIAYEPFPKPLTIDELQNTETYMSPAHNVDIVEASLSDDGYFSISTSLEKPGTPGFYHIRIWIDQGGVHIQALDVVLQMVN